MNFNRHTVVANFETRSVALIASWTLAGAALAQGMPSPAPPREDKTSVSALFTQADQNGDGLLSRAEAATVPGLEAAFDKMDTDRNGSLNADEFTRGTKG